MIIRWLGRMPFAEALALQNDLVGAIREGRAEETLLLLEHEPVYTIGRTRDQRSLVAPAHLPHPLFEINRGGQATYHGPGQLVGYPLCDLNRRGRDLHWYLRWLEEFLIVFCRHYGVEAQRREGLTGTWVGSRKIASIGVGVRHWITMHGFALNITPAVLSGFSPIIPCGIDGVKISSLEQEINRLSPVSPGGLTVEEVGQAAGQRFEQWQARPREEQPSVGVIENR